ncbi:MAG: Hypothetical NagD-like phosphatase, Actinobacterial subfamily, partial [uncultured Pseudonocardia sp.]
GRTQARHGVDDRHGRRPGARGSAHPRRGRVRHAAARHRHAVPRPHQQLDLHPARPAVPAAVHGYRPAGGGHLDLGAGHRHVPPRPAPAGQRVRRRGGRADDRAARHRLRAHRQRARLRGARRDPHLQLHRRHHRDPAHPGWRPVRRHQPRSDRPVQRRRAARHRSRRRADDPGHRGRPLLRRQAEPADDAGRPQPPAGPLRDHGDDRRPDGHRHRGRAGGRHAHGAGAVGNRAGRGGRPVPVPAEPGGVLDRRSGGRDL